MTVRINKPAINLREALSDLQREEGLRGLQILAADTAAEAVEALDLEDHTFDINNGSIDGTVIGGTTPAAISGTTGDFSGDLTVDTDTLFVDASTNRVGIGTSSPAVDLDVVGSTGSSFRVRNTSTTSFIRANFVNDASEGVAVVTYGSGYSAGSVFSLGAGGSFLDIDNDFGINAGSGKTIRLGIGNSEAMRIDTSGNLLVGTTAPTGAPENSNLGTTVYQTGLIANARDASGANLYVSKIGATSGNALQFGVNGSTVGTISVTTSATAYNTSSDYRLKENITDADDASDLIDGIQVRQFDWKADGEHQRYGMIAQELDTVAPEAVTKGETEEDMWAVDYSKLVPMLVKEIQDLRKRVAELEQ